MAKVVFKNLPQLKKSIRDTFEQVKSDTKMLLEIGEKTAELTRAFNRAGKSPMEGQGKHPKNSPAWEEKKMQLTKTNNPGEFYRPYLSNVNFTGQLIDSIRLIKIERSSASVIVGATGKREPYKSTTGKIMNGPKTNEELLNLLSKPGRLSTKGLENAVSQKSQLKALKKAIKSQRAPRIILGINRQMENVINRIVRRYINQAIKKFNKQ